MKKFIFVMAIISFFSCISFAKASVLENNNKENNNLYVLKASDSGVDCHTLFGDEGDPNDPAYWIQTALKIIKYLGIVFLLVYSTLDYIKAITAQDSDAVIKATKKTGLRLIYAVLLFFVPVIVSFFMNFLGLYGTCGYGESEGIGYVDTY